MKLPDKWFTMNRNVVFHGNNRDVLPLLPENSVDSIVTDPPYHLVAMTKRFGKAGSAPAKGPAYQRHNAGFMGKEWDGGDIAFDPTFWAECLRVLKPGGYVLSMGGTRTYHRMVCGVEDAGFEVRDCLSWLYGSGFPKSLNVSLAIDKAAGVVGNRGQGINVSGVGSKAKYGTAVSVKAGNLLPSYSEGITVEAKQWQGWGTALKPAAEMICLARKPLLEKSVAANVLEHGTGALNIDASRIHTEGSEGKDYTVKRLKNGATLNKTGGNWRPEEGGIQFSGRTKDGRWPANVILDEEAAELLGENSRFFYCAKASQAERSKGLDKRSTHPTVKPLSLVTYLIKLITPPSGVVLDPFLGSGTTALACIQEGFDFIGIEREDEYIEIIKGRIGPKTIVRKV